MNGISAQGMVIIHSAPRALLPHVEWAIGRLLGGPTAIKWTPQPLAQGGFRAEYHWQSSESFGSVLTSELMGWGALRFEITQDQTPGVEGWRWAFTPRLGLFQGQQASMGNVLVNEHRMRAILENNPKDAAAIERELRNAMGEPWDEELENFRLAGAEAPVIWLRSVSN